MAGSMSLGELIMINALLMQLMAPLDHLGANYMQLNQGLVDARDGEGGDFEFHARPLQEGRAKLRQRWNALL